MRRFLLLLFLTVSTLAIVLTACGGSEPAAVQTSAGTGVVRPAPPPEYAGKKNPMAANAAAVDAGKKTYNVYCSSCHGEGGKGDGPAAPSLNPRPQDLAGHETEMTDDYMFWRIHEGGMMEPFRSSMPAWKDALSDEQIWQVVAFLRTLGP